jgi:hypothetical protein
MTKNWRDLEILIGILLFLIGGVCTYLIILQVLDHLDSFRNHPHLYYDKVSVGSIIWTYHTVVVLLAMSAIGGGLIIFQRKWGWILSLMSSSILTIVLILVFVRVDLIDLSEKVIFYSIASILLLIAFTLFAKPFRIKYAFSRKEKIYILIMAFLLLVDVLYYFI